MGNKTGALALCIALALSMLIICTQARAARSLSTTEAAARHVPGVNWRAGSIVAGDFTCRGRMEKAILGTGNTEIVVAVFVRGTAYRPEVLRHSAKVRRAATAVLTIENLDFDPMEALGYLLPGFRQSKTCKGLNLTDGESDSAHIYWNREDHRFDDWVP
jgi:hypothetical protein